MKKVLAGKMVERDKLADALLGEVPLEFMHILRDYRRYLMKCLDLIEGITFEELASSDFLFKLYASKRKESVKILLHFLLSLRDAAHSQLDDEEFKFLVVWFLEGGYESHVWWEHYERKLLLKRYRKNRFLEFLRKVRLKKL